MIGVSTTTAQLRGAIPWQSPLPLGLTRVPVGIDVHTGSAFCFDPFQAYQRGIVTDPVMLVLGSKGSGKSTLVKSLAVRMAAHDYLIRHIDPKGEGHPLAAYFGVEPVRPGRVGHQSLRRTPDRRPGTNGYCPARCCPKPASHPSRGRRCYGCRRPQRASQSRAPRGASRGTG